MDGANAEAIGANGVAVDIARAGVVTVDAAGRGSYAVGGDGPASGISIAGGCSFASEHYGILRSMLLARG
jgi:hypothetical protein